MNLKRSVVFELVVALMYTGSLGAGSLGAVAFAKGMGASKAKAPVDLRFLGKVAKDAKREKTVTVTVETQLKDYAYLDSCRSENWQSTGLYAASGESITV